MTADHPDVFPNVVTRWSDLSRSMRVRFTEPPTPASTSSGSSSRPWRKLTSRRSSRKNVVSFCSNYVHTKLALPQAAQLCLHFVGKLKINCVAPPWGTWLRTHHWLRKIGEISKKKLPVGIEHRTSRSVVWCHIPLELQPRHQERRKLGWRQVGPAASVWNTFKGSSLALLGLVR